MTEAITMTITDTSEIPLEPTLAKQLVSQVDKPLERKRVGDMEVDKFAGLTFNEYRECVEFAKVMAQGKHSIPPYLRDNSGDCLAIITQSLRWHLEPFWVAQHSYVAKQESMIAYDAAVHAAIVLSCGKLMSRPRYTYAGEGEGRTCTVAIVIRGETTPHEYTTPPFKQCAPPYGDKGVRKGSPLWDKDPDQQLGYYAIRNWGRRHLPEVLGGVYDRDEFEETTQEEVETGPASPKLLERLPGKIEGAGFAENVIDAAIAKEATAEEEQIKAARKGRAKAVEPAGAREGEGVTADAKEPAQAAPEPPLTPQTAEQYAAYGAIWIERGEDPLKLASRWDEEQVMRADLRVSLGIRKRLEGMLRAKVNMLREESKKKRK
jgi:hypothetical protein